MRNRMVMRSALPLALLAMIAFAGCGGGGGGAGGDAEDDLGDLALIDLNVGGTDGVALNKIVVFEFSEQVVNSSVSAETMRIRLSPANAWQVPGTYYVNGNEVEFFPRLPNLPDLSDAGLQPGQTYEVYLPGGTEPNTLLSLEGNPLVRSYRVTFATAVASSPNLFIDYDPDYQPHVVSVNPRDEAIGVPQAIDIELTMSEPIHPATVTTSNVQLTLVERPPGTQLDPVRPIPGQVVLTQSRESVLVRFVPDFPLADNATYTLEVDRRVTDLVGNDLEPHFSTFTIRDEPPVPGEFVLDFEDGTEIYRDDEVTIASWNEDVPGALAGIFTAGAGDGSDGDFKPTGNVTFTTTSGKQTWQFKTFEVPSGVTIRLRGDYPVELMSLQTMRISGTIDASGYDGRAGESSTTTWSVPNNPGGSGGPGGGDGGDTATNVPSTSQYGSSYTGNKGTDGEDGWGTTGTGGGAATWGTSYYYTFSSAGGGGGGHRTKGEDGGDGVYQSYGPGKGGKGGGTGGNANLSPITAGGGGGPGQNMYYYYGPYNQGSGSGGGGGGALTLRCANNIEITGGTIKANGGDGGPSPSTYYMVGGAGGAGAGGAILIRSLKQIQGQGAKITADGGAGFKQSYTYYKGNSGGGGDGWLRIEDGDGFPEFNSTTISPSSYGRGTFSATGAGTPSVGQTLWINLGIFDPTMLAPQPSDLVTELPKNGHKIDVEVQMTQEDVFDLGNPDEDLASAWVPLADIATLNSNGYSFMRLRFTFTLANDQKVDDDVPFVDSIKLRFLY